MTPSDRQGAGADEALVEAVRSALRENGRAYDKTTEQATAALAAAGRVLVERLRAEGQRRAIHWRDEDTLDASGAADFILRLCGVPEGAGGGEG